jgi:hypothetical protein
MPADPHQQAHTAIDGLRVGAGGHHRQRRILSKSFPLHPHNRKSATILDHFRGLVVRKSLSHPSRVFTQPGQQQRFQRPPLPP